MRKQNIREGYSFLRKMIPSESIITVFDVIIIASESIIIASEAIAKFFPVQYYASYVSPDCCQNSGR